MPRAAEVRPRRVRRGRRGVNGAPAALVRDVPMATVRGAAPLWTPPGKCRPRMTAIDPTTSAAADVSGLPAGGPAAGQFQAYRATATKNSWFLCGRKNSPALPESRIYLDCSVVLVYSASAVLVRRISCCHVWPVSLIACLYHIFFACIFLNFCSPVFMLN